MTGWYEGGHAILPLTLRLLGRGDLSIECAIDTGFTGDLALPLAAVTAMELPYLEDTRANLANGSVIVVPVHVATVVWHGTATKVRVLATGQRPLIGTSLLFGSYLGIRFAHGGEVIIHLDTQA